MNLNELIEYFEDKQKRYLDLTPISKKVTDAVLKELKGKQSLLNQLNDDMLKPKRSGAIGMGCIEYKGLIEIVNIYKK